ncbi:phosphoglycerate mutase family domain protein [Penicillium brasilianum]|uniref:Phosphoglycerate mutase family domain protein n=1 Tax=Penicillium brasilianum TaxID=104259 RepID=A0A1S9S225_PENBI|nr:phosphoglycerate mutase family domain protein [Penicillium brasilianum]
MGKPRMIILVRHAQSEGNKNRDIHQSTPDHRVKLTPEGHRQAQEAGGRLRDLLRPDDTLHFFTSPYRRTRETTEGILESLTSDDPTPSPFPRHGIKVYEEPRLREQDFGNFQPCSTEMERMWMERADYGHFFYRIPNGESAADAYDRVSGFNESLWRLFGEEDFASVCVLVTHGLMTRVFLMKWYHWSVEYFEDLRNINHCEFVIMTLNPDNGKYTLQNKLRTWSDLRKERERERERGNEASGQPPVTTPSDHIPIRRKWGGCPDGCTHGLTGDARKSLRTQLMESMHRGHTRGSVATHPDQPSPLKHASSTPDSMEGAFPFPNDKSISFLHTTNNGSNSTTQAGDENKDTHRRSSSSDTRYAGGHRPVRPSLGPFRDSEDHLFHPPVSSSSTVNLKMALLHLGGRDGGGSMSGANSLAPSDDEGDDTDHPHHHGPRTGTPIPHSHSHSHVHSSSTSKPSQDLEDDGDDELSSHPTEDSKRHPHHHAHHHHHNHSTVHTHPNPRPSHHRQTSSTASQQPWRMANILGDGDDEISTSEATQTPRTTELPAPQANPDEKKKGNHPNSQNEGELSLEAQRREDQSIQGSVY